MYIFVVKQIDDFSFFAIALIRKYKNNPDVSITFVNEKKNHYSFLKGNFARFFFVLMMFFVFCQKLKTFSFQQPGDSTMFEVGTK